MIFETLWQSAEQEELILIDGAMCRWHLRKDGQITIYEIIVLPDRQREGKGRAIVQYLKSIPDATSLFARCPADLEANSWYQSLGFHNDGAEYTKTGRRLMLWKLQF